MPLNIPNLDDRTYNDLVKEALTLIPGYTPQWTDHNPSDPGITLIEMFAYLTDMLIYRVNRVTDDNYQAFLKLINGPDWQPPSNKSLDLQIRETIASLRDTYRAVTASDFERLAQEADPGVARAYCLPRRNLGSGSVNAANMEEPGYVSVIIVPAPSITDPQMLNYTARDYLDTRRLLTTQVQVVSPRYFSFDLRLKLVLKPDVEAEKYLSFSLDVTFLEELNTNDDNFSSALQQAFEEYIAFTLQKDLDNLNYSLALQQAFENHGVLLSRSVDITVQEHGSKWLITDKQNSQTYLICREAEHLKVYQNDVQIAVLNSLLAPSKMILDVDKEWLVGDKQTNQWYLIRREAGTLNVYEDNPRSKAIKVLKDYYHPLTGGEDGNGWTFGRAAYISEIYHLLDALPEVDYVTKIKNDLDEMVTDANRLLRNAQDEIVGVKLQPDELIDIQQMNFLLIIATAGDQYD